ncbi:MAG TPA: dipeptide ABC transporter ATP-binding protein, partial [Negativicutes bacterium]|nr:dipeptide ABC transporter ATP-binding protein [Negativicutes bacterium]
MAERLVEVRDLKKWFPIKKGFFKRTVGYVKAVDGLNFYVNSGETLGIVGESGCGKSTMGRTVLRLLEPTNGKILFEGSDITELDKESLRAKRRDMQIIFQDPFASLDPRMSIGSIISEPLRVHRSLGESEMKARVAELLDAVGLSPDYASRYPHEFSGGQRQRIGIARAIALNPKLVVCDEPVSALDVSVQGQIINLLQELKERFSLTYIFIAHDLGVVRHISDRVAVMYLGKIVELAEKDELYDNPMNPYTKVLLQSVPVIDPDAEKVDIALEGEIPSPANPPSGCRFHTRCSMAVDICSKTEPELVETAPGHFCACHLHKA